MGVIIALLVGSVLLGMLMAVALGPSDKEKYYHYKNREFEEKHPDKRVNSYRDMKK